MKKRFTALMAMVIIVGTICMAGTVMAEDVVTLNGDIGGAVPVIRQIDSVSVDTAMKTGTPTFFTGILVSDYDAGFKTSDAAATTVTVTANDDWEVTVSAGLTGNVFTTSPLGKGDEARAANTKPLSDLLIKVSGINEGTDENAATPTIDGTWDLSESAVMTFAAKDMVTCASGNDSASWDIQYKMLLDTSKDTPGGYSCNIIYTIQAIADGA